jgi:hypothetical protein
MHFNFFPVDSTVHVTGFTAQYLSSILSVLHVLVHGTTLLLRRVLSQNGTFIEYWFY